MRKPDGFTLIEMLVVLTIMGLLAVVLITPRRSNQSAHTSDESTLLSALLAARASALETGISREVDLEALGSHVQWHPSFPHNSIGPRFFADGSAYGGTISLSNRKNINIIWVNGDVQPAP